MGMIPIPYLPASPVQSHEVRTNIRARLPNTENEVVTENVWNAWESQPRLTRLGPFDYGYHVDPESVKDQDFISPTSELEIRSLGLMEIPTTFDETWAGRLVLPL